MRLVMAITRAGKTALTSTGAGIRSWKTGMEMERDIMVNECF